MSRQFFNQSAVNNFSERDKTARKWEFRSKYAKISQNCKKGEEKRTKTEPSPLHYKTSSTLYPRYQLTRTAQHNRPTPSYSVHQLLDVSDTVWTSRLYTYLAYIVITPTAICLNWVY